MIKLKRKKSICIFPHSDDSYPDIILKSLNFINQEKPSKDEYSKWLQQIFPTVENERSIKDDQEKILHHLGLIVNEKNIPLSITDIGLKFIQTKEIRLLIEQLKNEISGFSEIIDFIKIKPATKKEILHELNVEYGFNWNSVQQVSNRIRWLKELNYVIRKEKKYCLNNKIEKNNCEKKIQTNKTHVNSRNHTKIGKAIVEAGKILGRFPERNYHPSQDYIIDVVWKKHEDEDPSEVFEVQLDGNMHSALTRLKHASEHCGHAYLFLITDKKQF